MSVLDRASLEQSPLADLHAIASELGIDGYRRLRKADLIEALLAKQGGGNGAVSDDAGAEEEAPRPRRSRRGTRAKAAEEDAVAETDAGAVEEQDEEEKKPARPARGGRTARVADKPAAERGSRAARVADKPAAERGGRAARGADKPAAERGGRAERTVRDAEDRDGDDDAVVVEGVVELLSNGSGFMRVSPPEPSDDDVYISAAQAKRCELVSGDQIAGPRRPPRRSERFPSLIRIDMINGRPATEVSQTARFDDLPAAFPSERLKLGSEDETVKAIEWLTPFGRGSRVSIVGGPRAGKTEALLRLAVALSGQEDLQILVALAGVRPEEIGEWAKVAEPAAAVALAASPDAQAGAVEQVVDQARRLVTRGANVVVLIDTLEGMPPGAARKALAAARNVVDGGSLTVIATAAHPVGGETTVIALDPLLASTGRFPALDLVHSGTTRPELLVGEPGAEAIARARAEAIDG